MNTENFTLKIYTPAGLILEETVSTAIAPGFDGQIGLLPGHVRYTGCLGTGVLELTEAKGGATRKVALAGGFCTFVEDTMTVLADWATLPDEVNKSTYAVEREKLAGVVRESSSWEPAWDTAREKLARIEAIDAVLK